MRISTGSGTINAFLKGYNTNEITLIYGEPSTGKTTLGLLATIAQAKNNKKVIYIDTEKGFSIERWKQLNKTQDYLKNVLILRPQNFEEQHKVINNLPTKNIALIIIDTLGHFYRIALKENYKEANKKVDQQLQSLKEITQKNVPVILINQVYDNYEKGITPVGGSMIKNWCQTIIKLEKEPRKIIREKKEKKEALFEIKNETIEIRV